MSITSQIRSVNYALGRALEERAPSAPSQKKGPQPLVVPSSTPRNPYAQDAQNRKGGTMKNPKDKRVDGGNKNWRRHMDHKRGPAANVKEDAHPPKNVDFGKPYGGEPYTTPSYGPVWMFRKGQKCRWYDAQGNQIGPEQGNVAPALAYAMSRGWQSMRDVRPNKTEGVTPRFVRPMAEATKSFYAAGDEPDMQDFKSLGVGAKISPGDVVWAKFPWEHNGRLRKGVVKKVEFNGPVSVKIDMPGLGIHGQTQKMNPVDLYVKKSSA